MEVKDMTMKQIAQLLQYFVDRDQLEVSSDHDNDLIVKAPDKRDW
jgi:hypothetical protein